VAVQIDSLSTNVFMTSLRSAWVAAAVTGTIVFGGPAHGQTPRQATVDRDTVPAAELAPVMVEVFRTPVVLERAPYSASVVGEDQIRRGKPGLALDEALRGVPGVQVDNRYNYALGERISVRGFGARAQFGVRGIKVIADGIPATFPDGQSAVEIIDPGLLGRVEVIRGPASALYGNAAGGVISFRSAPVAPVPLHQQYRVVGGEHGLRRVEGQLSGRSGVAEYRFGASHFAWGGFREYSAAEHLRANGSAAFSLGAGTLRLSGAFLDFEAENPGALPLQAFRETPERAAPMNITRQAGKDGRQRQLGVTWTSPLAGGEVEVAGYGIHRWVRNPIVPFVIDLDRNAGGVRGVYRGALGAATSWTTGFDVDLQRDDRQNYVNANGEPGNLVRDQEERVRSAAPFFHVAARLLPALDVMAGVRYDHFRFEVDDRLAAEGRPDESGARVMAALSPSVGVLYGIRDGVSVFANVATAFETPTTTELANRPDEAGGFNPELEPQRTLSVEAGLRGGSERAGFQLAAYRAGLRNALIPFEVLNVPGRTYFRNAGTAVHRGVEAGGWVRGPWGLRTQVGYTFTDAVFRDFEARGIRYDGNRVPGVSPHRAEVALIFELEAGPYLGVEGRYGSRTPADDANTEHAPEYTVLDFRAGHAGWRRGAMEFRPFVGITNLLDHAYAASVVPNAAAAAGQPRPFYEPAPGRSIYLGLEVGIGR
jgi:iron complex outermembrane recepter protein